MILLLQDYNVDGATFATVYLVGYLIPHLLQVPAKDLSKV